jgi:peptidoglycan/LPS O-acetylase OafA/YrhL
MRLPDSTQWPLGCKIVSVMQRTEGELYAHIPGPRASTWEKAVRFSYHPELDGIRAFAVFGVMAYHGGLSWMPGGYLGVNAFFVLSGFLITSLLIAEMGKTRRLALGGFWSRRARRLLPALLAMLGFVAIYAAFIVGLRAVPGLRLDTLSALFYVANWHFIMVHNDYFLQSAAPSPVLHTWSLAIEEQFYLIWPLVVIGVLAVSRRFWKRRDPRGLSSWLDTPLVLAGLGVVALLGALASATEMALLFKPGTNPARVYYGTDTRAQGLLLGAVLAIGLAMWWRSKALRLNSGEIAKHSESVNVRRALNVGSLAAVGILAWAWSHMLGTSTFAYRGGFFLCAICVLTVITAVVLDPECLVGRVLGLRPIRYLGRISYGIYLWHWPLFLTLNEARTGLVGYPLFAVRVAATLAVSVASYHLLEQPIRRGTFLKNWRSWIATPAAVVGMAAVLIAATPVTAAFAKGAPKGDKAFGAKPPTCSLAGSACSSAIKVSEGEKLKALVSAVDQEPVRVLLVGDSTALTLGVGMSYEVQDYGIVLWDKGILGCGLVDGPKVMEKGQVFASAPQCAGHPGVASRWTHEVQIFHPDVSVLLAGRWEVENRYWRGHFAHVGTAPGDLAYDAYVKQRMNLAVSILSSAGAHVVLMTAPCYDTGEQPDGLPWPSNKPDRVDEYNSIVEQVAAEHPKTVSVYHLHALICPDGHFEFDPTITYTYRGQTKTVSNVQVRTSDGIHFTIPGGELLGRAILPYLRRIGHKHMLALLAKGRSVPLPASKLPWGVVGEDVIPPAS